MKTHLWIIVFQPLVWTVENDVKTLVWTQSFLSVFGEPKTEVFKNALVWTGSKPLVALLETRIMIIIILMGKIHFIIIIIVIIIVIIIILVSRPCRRQNKTRLLSFPVK